MDSLLIENLSLETRIGVHDWEQRIMQRLLISITINRDFSTCDETLANTIDYAALCQQIGHFVTSNQFQLIETVANQIATLIKTNFLCDTVTVKVNKPQAIPNASAVCISVTR